MGYLIKCHFVDACSGPTAGVMADYHLHSTFNDFVYAEYPHHTTTVATEGLVYWRQVYSLTEDCTSLHYNNNSVGLLLG